MVSMETLLEKYAGEYEVELAGPKQDDLEMYQLNSDGTAAWYWSTRKSNGSIRKTEKRGSWTASENLISITISGVAGDHVEDYNFFRVGDRYLKRFNRNPV